jgi:hypothetical protein
MQKIITECKLECTLKPLFSSTLENRIDKAVRQKQSEELERGLALLLSSNINPLKTEFFLNNIKIQFVPHRKHITSLLQRPTS